MKGGQKSRRASKKLSILLVGIGAVVGLLIANQLHRPENKKINTDRSKAKVVTQLGRDQTTDEKAKALQDGVYVNGSADRARLSIAKEYLASKKYDKAAAMVTSLATNDAYKRQYTCDVMLYVYQGKKQTAQLGTATSYCVQQLLQDPATGTEAEAYQDYNVAAVYEIGGDKQNAKKYYQLFIGIIKSNQLQAKEEFISMYEKAKQYVS